MTLSTFRSAAAALALCVLQCDLASAQGLGAPPPGSSPKGAFGVDASSQFGEAPDLRGAKLGPEVVQRYQIGMIVTAQGGPCQGIYATAPVPTDWPEQKVEIVNEEFTTAVQKIDYRMVGGTVKQMLHKEHQRRLPECFERLRGQECATNTI